MRSGSPCALLWRLVLVSPQRNSSEGSTHPRSLECNSRQAVQTQSSDRDRVVPVSAGVQSLVLKMGPATSQFNHKLSKFVSPVLDKRA